MQSQTFWAKKTCVYAVKHENVKQKGDVTKTIGLFTVFYHNNPSPMERTPFLLNNSVSKLTIFLIIVHLLYLLVQGAVRQAVFIHSENGCTAQKGQRFRIVNNANRRVASLCFGLPETYSPPPVGQTCLHNYFNLYGYEAHFAE